MRNQILSTWPIFITIGLLTLANKSHVQGLEQPNIPVTLVTREQGRGVKAAGDQRTKSTKLQFIVEIVNTSKSQIILHTSSKNYPFLVKILDSKGKLVNSEILKATPRVPGMKRTEWILAPSEKKSYTIEYPGEEKEKSGFKLSPGSYRISAVFALNSFFKDDTQIDLGKIVILKSNEIQVTVGTAKKHRSER